MTSPVILHAKLCAALVIAALLGSAPALARSEIAVEQLAPQAPAPEVDPDAAPDADAAPSGELVITQRDGVVSAVMGMRGLWRHHVFPADERSSFVGPAVMGAHAVYCAQGHLYFTRLLTGEIDARAQLPGDCRALEREDASTLRLEVGAEGAHAWSRSLRVREGGVEGAVTLVTTTPAVLRMMLRRQASSAMMDGSPAGIRALSEPLADAQRLALRDSLVVLEGRALQDKTNPWFRFERAMALHRLGEDAQAREEVALLLGAEGIARQELITMALPIDAIDEALGEQVFEAGLGAMVAAGYIPELSLGLLSLVSTLGSSPLGRVLDPDLEDAQVWASSARYMERLHRVAPLVEGSAAFYDAMARGYATRQDPQAQARVQAWADQARPFLTLGAPSPEARRMGGWLNLSWAGLWAILLLVGVKTLRTAGARFDRPVSAALRFNPLARWRRGEVVGLLLVIGLVVGASWQMAAGVSVVGVVASAPMSVLDGQLGHPEATASIDVAGDGAGLVGALSAQLAGDQAQAEARYRPLDAPRAWNNLGVIRAAQGRAEEARALFARADAATLPQAAQNLAALEAGQPPAALAAPSEQDWARFWRARAAKGPGLLDSALGGASLMEHLDDTLAARQLMPIAPPMMLILTLLSVLALAVPRRGAQVVPWRWGRLGWGVGLVVPGAAPQYSVLGGLMLTFALWLVIGAYFLASTQGSATNVLDAISGPSLQRFFGVVSQPRAPGAYAKLCGWWQGALVLHAVVMALMVWRWPDALNPFASARGATVETP